MKFYISIILLLTSKICFSQNSGVNVGSINLTDTIHISGIVLDSSNKPVIDVQVFTPLHRFGVSTSTDSKGTFFLANVRLKDTIFVRSINSSTTIINNGSRFLKILIPSSNYLSRHIKTTVKIEGTTGTKKEALNLNLSDKCFGCCLSNELHPEFPGGIKKLNEFIKNQLVYPEKALKENIEGEVIVQILVGKDGTPKDFTIISGLSPECDEAALNSMKQMPKWKPAIYNGKSYEYPQSVAIQFAIARR